MPSTTGRRVVEYLTNKSGGAVAAGDVVIIDTGNNESFTTTTTGGFTGMVGVAQEAIANNSAGRVLTAGYAALVNVNASVTRGNYGKTHTVAKQATDAGASRATGVFCQFLTGGTTPSAHVFGLVDASSSGATISSCMAQRTSTLSVNANPKALAYDAADLYDPDGWHDPASNPERFTCPSGKGGKVFTVSYSIEWDGTSGATPYIAFKKNAGGTVVATAPLSISAFTGVGAFPVFLNDGDYIAVSITGRTTGNIIVTDAPCTLGIIG